MAQKSRTLLDEIQSMILNEDSEFTDKQVQRMLLASMISFDSRLTHIERLAPALNALVYVGGILAVSAVGLIWSLITGQLMIVVP